MKKTKQRARPAKRGRRRTANAKEQKPIPSDIEDLLVEMVFGSGSNAVNGTDLENLIYNTTPSLGSIAYGFGFSVGRAATLKLGMDAPLNSVLDRIGLHDSLYYPLRDKVIITSRPHQHNRVNLGRNIHVYEAGVISGYLSTSTGMQVTAEEKRCIYNGSRECQFAAIPLSPKPTFSGMGIEQAAGAISATLGSIRFTKSEGGYYRPLAYLPLTDSKISKHILKMMVMTGERIGEAYGKGYLNQLVSNLANYFGVKDAKVERKGRKTIIKLRYESYNSIHTFVAIPAAMIVGFAKSTGRSPQASFTTNSDGTYTAHIVIDSKRR